MILLSKLELAYFSVFDAKCGKFFIAKILKIRFHKPGYPVMNNQNVSFIKIALT